MKQQTARELRTLRPGAIFTLTRGGVQLELLPGRSAEGNRMARILGDKTTQTLTDNFPVYLIRYNMKKNELATQWPKIFSNHYLIRWNGETALAATLRKISAAPAIAYLPTTDELARINPSDILCTIKIKPRPAE